MKKWQIEVNRTLGELAYFHQTIDGARRGTLLDFEAEVMADSFVYENPFFDGVNIGGDWLRRHIIGGWNKRTNDYYFTIPRPDRLQALTAFIAKKGFVIDIAIDDHREAMNSAWRIALLSGFDRFADQRLLSGTFRGMFHGVRAGDGELQEFILLVHFIKGEPFFRIRLIQCDYSGAGQSFEAQTRFDAFSYDRWDISDLFAIFGTNEGRVFGGQGNGVLTASDYVFACKGRRVVELTLSGLDGGHGSVRLKLCRQPADIDRAIGLLKRLSADMGSSLAAE